MDGGDEHLDAHGYMHKHIGALGYTRVMTMATLAPWQGTYHDN